MCGARGRVINGNGQTVIKTSSDFQLGLASLERHQIFNDVWGHCHQSLSMTSFIIVIVISHRHCHFFFILSIILTFRMSF